MSKTNLDRARDAITHIPIRADIYRAVSLVARNRGFSAKRGIEIALLYAADTQAAFDSAVRKYVSKPVEKLDDNFPEDKTI